MLSNSGTKNVKKSILKITKGPMKNSGVTWFPDLVDKRMFVFICRDIRYAVQYLGKGIKLHLYWAMQNCGGDADKLRELVGNIVNHYQV